MNRLDKAKNFFATIEPNWLRCVNLNRSLGRGLLFWPDAINRAVLTQKRSAGA